MITTRNYFASNATQVYFHDESDGNDTDLGCVNLSDWSLRPKNGMDDRLRMAVADKLGLDPSAAPTVPEPIDLPFHDLSENAPGASIADKKGRGWRLGYEGELKTAGLLSSYPRVLHSVLIRGNKDIDHVVFSTRGVFTVNTKATSGKAVIDGNEGTAGGTYINWPEAADGERLEVDARLSEALGMSVEVRPVIAVWGDLEVRKPGCVPVIPASELPAWIDSQPVRYEERWVSYVYNACRNPAVWRAR